MGYDLNRLIDCNTIDEQFLCPICCGIIEKPKLLLECQHIFCEDCITKWVSLKHNCPINGCLAEDLSLSDVSAEYEQNYSRIQLKCRNSTRGCRELILINQANDHDNQCEFSKDNYHTCQCGDYVNKKDENHSCLDHLKNQIQNLRSNQTKLELINKELDSKLKLKTEEWLQLRRFLNFSKLSETTPELRDLVEALKDLHIIRSTAVERAFLTVDRRLFCPQNPYSNHRTGIGFGAEFNSPVIDSIVLEGLRDRLVIGAQVLDIGCGMGYLSSCMAMICANQCIVVGVDHIPELIEGAKRNAHEIFAQNNSIQFEVGDGREGYPSLAPYDVINVGASFEELPIRLLEQLSCGGRMCCAIGPEAGPQDLIIVDKLSDGSLECQTLMKVTLKPMTDRDIQLSNSLIV